MALRHAATDRLDSGSFLVTEAGIYRETPAGLLRFDGASTMEELTDLLDRAGQAYVLEEEARDRVWIHCR